MIARCSRSANIGLFPKTKSLSIGTFNKSERANNKSNETPHAANSILPTVVLSIFNFSAKLYCVYPLSLR